MMNTDFNTYAMQFMTLGQLAQPFTTSLFLSL